MRLVCPNCDAKYEVPEDAIPDSGRDVQCANCSHAWFEVRTRSASASIVTKRPDPERIAESATSVAASVESEPMPEAETIAAIPTHEESSHTPEPGPAEDQPQGMGAEADQGYGMDAWPELAEDADPVLPTAARAVDEGVLTILREEAERETKARRSEGQSQEGQPDLGGDAALVTRKKGPGKKAAPEPVESASAFARRNLLPDVEEIHSSLRPSELPEVAFVGDPDAVALKGRGAFRSGFLLVLSAAILGGAVYIASGWLADLIPALEGPLKAYVGVIDGFRLNLDSLMQSATRMISGKFG